MRSHLLSLLLLLPLVGCHDADSPVSPGGSAPDGDGDGPRFALDRPSPLLVPAPAAAIRQSELPGWRPNMTSADQVDGQAPAGPSHIVWENVRTGLRVFWHMSGTTWGGSQNDLSTVDAAWTIVASADFTGDGQADLLWQHRQTGSQVIWHMNGFAWTGQQTALSGTEVG